MKAATRRKGLLCLSVLALFCLFAVMTAIPAAVNSAPEAPYIRPIDGYYDGEEGSGRTANDGGLSIWMVNDTASTSGIDGLCGFDTTSWGRQVCEKVADYVLINGKTFTELNAEIPQVNGKNALERYVMAYSGNLLCFRVHMDQGASGFNINSVETVTFLPGFTWYKGDNATEIPELTVKEKYTMEIVQVDGTWMARRKLAEDGLTVKTPASRTEYTAGESFDPTGMVLTAVYEDGGTADIEVLPRMCAAALTADQTEAEIFYNGQSVSQAVTVAAASAVKSIALHTAPDSMDVQWRSDAALPGMKITVTYQDDSTAVLDVTPDMITLDTLTEGDAEAVITYEGQTLTQVVNVVDLLPDVKIAPSLTWNSESYSESTLRMTLDWIGETGCLRKSYWALGKYRNNAELIKINGKTVADWQAENAKNVARVFEYGQAIGFNFDNQSVLSSSKVETIEILRGFQIPNTADGKDHWGDDSYTDFVATNAIVKEDYKLTRIGTSWVWTPAAENAVRIVKNPDLMSLPYGSEFSPAGMQIEVTDYKGGKTTVDVTADMIVSSSLEVGAEDNKVMFSYAGATFELTGITVTNPVSALTLKSAPSSTEVELFQRPDLAGMVLTVTYADDTFEDIDVTASMLKSCDTSALGDTVAVIEIAGKTYEQPLTVIDSTPDVYVGFKLDWTTGTEATGDNKLSLDVLPVGVSGEWKAYWSLLLAGNNAELMLINGRTVADWQTEDPNLVRRVGMYGTRMVIYFDKPASLNTSMVETIEFLPGFYFPDKAADSWGSDSDTNFIDRNAYVKKHYIFAVDAAAQEIYRPVEFVSAEDSAESYYIDQTVDPSTLTVTYRYLDTPDVLETLAVRAGMLSYDFSRSGAAKITVAWNHASIDIDVTVANTSITGIELTGLPDKLVYDWGVDFEIDLTGAELVVKLTDADSQAVSTVPADISLATVSGYNSSVRGTQTITLTWGIFATTFDIEVDNLSADKYVFLIPDSGASFETTAYHALKIAFGFSDGMGSFNMPALWNISSQPNVAEFIYINGVRADVLMETCFGDEPLLTRINTYGKDLIFNLDNIFLQATDDAGRSPYVKWQEGKSLVVTEVTFKAGLQLYYADGDAWGNDAGIDTYKPIPGGILKEDYILTNLNGNGWVRKLKTNLYGTLADDAIEFTLPTKTEYRVGEELDIAGASLKVNFEDGGSAVIPLRASAFRGFSSDEAGTCTVTYTYNGHRITFNVTVTDGGGNSDDGNGGCNKGEAQTAAAAGVLAVFCAAAVVFKRGR